MARIVEHPPAEALEARFRAARDATEARHYQAIWLLAQGRTVLELTEAIGRVPHHTRTRGGVTYEAMAKPPGIMRSATRAARPPSRRPR